MAVDIIRLEGHNIFSYQDIDLNLDNLGLVLIAGHNADDEGLDSNASGKTTIFKILTWTLFGETLCKQNADDVVRTNIRTKKQVKGKTWGKVTIRSGDDIIEVQRYRKHNDWHNALQLYMNGDDITGANQKATQARIHEILHMDATAFINTVLFPQQAAGFASGTDAQQKAILDRILSLSRFQKAQDKLKERRKELGARRNSVTSSGYQLGKRQEECAANIKRLAEENEKFFAGVKMDVEKAEKDLLSLDKTKPVQNDELKQRLEECTRNSKMYEQMNEDMKRAQSKLEIHRNRYSLLTGEKEALKNSKEVFSDPPPKSDITSEDAERTLNAARRDLSRSTADRETAQTQINALATKIQQRDSTTECYTCGQPLTEEIKDKLFGSLTDDLESAKYKMEAAEKAIEAHKAAVKYCEKQHEEATTWERWEALFLSTRQTDKRIAEIDSELEPLSTEIKTIEEVLEKAEEFAKTFQNLEDEKYELRKQISDFESELRLWNAKYKNAVDVLNTARNRISPYKQLIADEKEKLKRINKEIQLNTDELAAIDKEIPFVEYWIRGFGNSGVKSILLEHVTPFLNDKANEYMAALCGSSAKIKFNTKKTLQNGQKKDQFNVEVNYQYGCKDLRGVSGGELRRADVAILLALGDLVASRALSPIRMRLLDEPFDNLDSSGIERVVDLLQSKVEPNVGTLLVITHNADLQALFDNVIHVEKSGGISRIVQ